MFWNSTEVIVAQHGECTQCHQIFHLKMTNFMLRGFHLSKNTQVKIKNRSIKKIHRGKYSSIQRGVGGGGGHTFFTHLGRGDGVGGPLPAGPGHSLDQFVSAVGAMLWLAGALGSERVLSGL